MEYGIVPNQNQMYLPLQFNPPPAIFNSKAGTLSFLPHSQPTNKFNMIQNMSLEKNRILAKEYRVTQYSSMVTRQLSEENARMIPGSLPVINYLSVNGLNIANSNLLQHQFSSDRNGVIQGFHPSTNQLLVNRSNMVQCSNLQYSQLSSNRTQTTQVVQPATNRLPENEIIIPQQSHSLNHQLPSNGVGMNQNSSMFNQKLPKNADNMCAVKPSAAHEFFQNEFRRNREKALLIHQQSCGEFNSNQDLNSGFQCHSEGGLNMLQNPFQSSKEICDQAKREFSCPSTNNFPRRVFNENQSFPPMNPDLPLSDPNLNQNLYSQYSEKLHICVVGPPRCGKDKLIRTFVRNDNVRVSKDKPLKLVVQEGMVSFGVTLKIDIWCAEEMIPAIQDLKSLCGSSKSAIVLVYNVTQRCTLLAVEEWIKLLKRDLDIKVPIILVGNKRDVENSLLSKKLIDDGIRLKVDNDLVAFYECLIESDLEVEEIFLFAALKAFLSEKRNS